MKSYILMQKQVNNNSMDIFNIKMSHGQHGHVQLDGLFKEYGHHVVVDQISIHVIDLNKEMFL